jgi:hypothetical protein
MACGETERWLKIPAVTRAVAVPRTNALLLYDGQATILMTRRPAPLLLLMPLLLATGSLAALSLAPTPARAAPAAAAAGGMTMDQAVKMAEKRFHARVVRAETQKDSGRNVYVLRLLNDTGHVWTVQVDAATGSVK